MLNLPDHVQIRSLIISPEVAYGPICDLFARFPGASMLRRLDLSGDYSAFPVEDALSLLRVAGPRLEFFLFDVECIAGE